jgi:hypothetical protein
LAFREDLAGGLGRDEEVRSAVVPVVDEGADLGVEFLEGAEGAAADGLTFDQTTWTAVAPDVIRTVRTYATAAGYGHRLVRKAARLRPLQASKHGHLCANTKIN